MRSLAGALQLLREDLLERMAEVGSFVARKVVHAGRVFIHHFQKPHVGFAICDI